MYATAEVLAVALVGVVGLGLAVVAVLKAPVVGVVGSLALLSLVDARTVATVVVSVCAAVVALASVARLKPIRWLGRTLVGDPVTHRGRAVITEQVTEVVTPMFDQIIERLDRLEARPDGTN